MINIKRYITEKQSIPDLPMITLNILQVIGNPESTVDDLAAIIKASPSLTTKVLSVANSGFFSIRGSVSKLSDAISFLGLKAVTSIALSLSIADNVSESKTSLEVSSYWERSLFHAIAAKSLAERVGYSRSEECFVAGLLSDISYMFLFRNFHDEYRTLMQPDVGVAERLNMEMDYFGMTHPEISCLLLSKYNIPQTLLKPIEYHHTRISEHMIKDPESLHACKVTYSSAQISDLFYQGFKKASNIKLEIEQALGLSVNELEQMLASIGTQVKEVSKFFGFDAAKFPSYFDILEQANEELLLINLSYEEILRKLETEKELNERLTAKLEESNRKLLEQVLRDPLTGAYNRRFLNEVLDKKIADARRYSHTLTILAADIDHFKIINDTYGHDGGDVVLKRLVALFNGCLRSGDVLARTGGEEFIFVFQIANTQDGPIIAERLRVMVEQTPFKLPNGKELRITMSFGMALFKPTYEHRDAFIKVADNLLYSSKAAGRNRVSYG